MTLEELRVELDRFFCGCGAPELAAAKLLLVLDALAEEHPPGGSRRAWSDEWRAEHLGPDEGTQLLLLYFLTSLDWIEHGGNVFCSWPTLLGDALREALRAEAGASYERVFAPHCAHGRDAGGAAPQCPDCAATPVSLRGAPGA